MRWTRTTVVALAGLLGLAGGPDARSADARVTARTAPHRSVEPHAATRGLRLPLAFESNRGQTDSRVRFTARARSLTAFVTDAETVFALHAPRSDEGGDRATDVVRMRFVGANPSPVVEGCDELPGRCNYFLGNDASKWVTDVPTCARAVALDVYPGIDVHWYGDADRRLRYDVVVAPGADPSAVSFALAGAHGLEVEGDGTLVAATDAGELRQTKPVAYQRVNGVRRAVDAAFGLTQDGRVRFDVGMYDARRPLVIDPSVTYSTFLGGGGLETGFGIAVDSTGAVYVTGDTASSDFPLQAALQGSLGGAASDAFVTKLNAAGSAMVYSTFLGGSGLDTTHGIAVDGSGAAYVTGRTVSSNFPTQSPMQSASAGNSDVFVAKIAPSGSSLAYSTYLGGSGNDFVFGIALDAGGAAYVTGDTTSTNFPVQSALQSGYGGGTYDTFVAKLNASGSALTYSTYLGGSGLDRGKEIAVDSAGAAYVTGLTGSADFPVQSPFQSTLGGSFDVFVTKLDASGSSLVYSTYLGGTGNDEAYGIAVDSPGAAYVTGLTVSSNFPTQSPLQGSYGGGVDGFVAKLAPSGTSLVFSTYLGGSGSETYRAIAVDAGGAATVGGWGGIAGVAKLDSAGSALVFSTQPGGVVEALTLDSSGDAYATGYISAASSANFPVQSALQSGFGGGNKDAFVAKFAIGTGGGPPPPPVPPPAAPTNLVAVYVDGGDVTLTWTDNSTNESGFEIERRSESSVFELLGTTGANATSAPDRQLQPSTTYTYRVRAFNAAGASAYTNERSITTAATQPPPPPPVVPEAPSGLVALPSADGTVHLSWLDNSDDETVFRVQRADAGGRFDGVGVTQADVAEFDDADVRRGWPVAYRVRAASLDGASAYSNTAPATVPATIELALTKGSRTDSAKLFRDRLEVAATYAAGGPVLDPAARGLELVLGPQDVPFKLTVAAGDPAWKVRRGKATWKSAKGASPKVAVVLDTKRRRLTVTVSGGSFFRSSTPLVNVLLACGADGGGVVANWTERKPGVLRFAK